MAVFPTPTSARTSAIITVTITVIITVIITVKTTVIITVIITAQNPEASPGQGNEISGCPGFPHPCYPDISGNSCRQSSRGRHPSGGEEEEEVSRLIGYARVSSGGECLDVQKHALDKADVYQLFVDVASGGKAKLPQLELALSLLGEGDTLVVWRLDRLGRSLGHLIRTVEELGSRGVGFRSLDENIDTTTGTSEPLSHFFAALGQSDRNLIQERTAAGRAAARACGRRGGRKPKLDEEQRAQAATLYSHGLSVDDICATLQIAPSTFFRVRRQENKRKAGRKPKTKTADRLSTDQGRKLSENAPQTVDNPKHSPTIARADSSSPHPPAASAVASPRPVATAPSRPMNRVPAEGTAAQPPGFKRAWHRSARFAPPRREGSG